MCFSLRHFILILYKPLAHKSTHIQALEHLQETPPAVAEQPWRLCWSSMLTANIALHSLFILSVLGPAWFTYSRLYSLAANRLNIQTVHHGVEFDSPLTGTLNWFFRPAVYFPTGNRPVALLNLVSCLLESNDQRPPPPLFSKPPNLSLSLYHTTDKIMGKLLLSFWKLFPVWQWVTGGSSW